MKKLTVTVEQEQTDKNMIIVSGGRQDNPTWNEYLEDISDEWLPRIKALKEFIKGSEYYKITAENFCNDNHFRFSDGREIAYSWRAWGDLMQSIVGEKEGYMTYYM